MNRKMGSILPWLAAVLTFAGQAQAAFPVVSMTVNSGDAVALVAGTNVVQVAEKLINKELSKVLKTANAQLSVDEGDIVLRVAGEEKVKDNCWVRVIGKADLQGTVRSTSSFKFGVTKDYAFADVLVNARLKGKASARVTLGTKRLFSKKCIRLSKRTSVGVDVDTVGTNNVEARLRANNLRVDKVNGRAKSIRFNVDFELIGKTVKWDLNKLKLTSCKIPAVFGVWSFMDFCKLIPIRIEGMVNKYFKKVIKVHSPKLISKVESLVQSKIGSQVVINIR